jgi:hypothetical protein
MPVLMGKVRKVHPFHLNAMTDAVECLTEGPLVTRTRHAQR